MAEITCEYCGQKSEKSKKHVARSRKLGLKMYCNSSCYGKSRRVHRSEEEMKERKRRSNKQYREMRAALKGGE